MTSLWNLIKVITHTLGDSKMTYWELLKDLKKLSEEQLSQEVMVFDMDEEEFYPTTMIRATAYSDGIMGKGHPYIPF